MPTKKTFFRFLFWLSLSGFSLALVGLGGLYLALSPKLPSVETLKEVKLQTPLRVYSRDNKLIGEFGEQRRTPLAFEDIPPLFIKALLAAEDAEFYSHPGVSLRGLLRAGSQILQTGQIQGGGSTITMQLARDFFLSRRQLFSRKFNEILLSFRIEQQLTKDEILELFCNKMFFGNHAYGLQAAAQIYYGKNADQLSLAQYATMVGSLKAPSAYNAIANPRRALIRRNWIIGRMLELGYIDQATHNAAIAEPIETHYHGLTLDLHAPYVAEVARQQAVELFGEAAYTDGYRVFTSVDSQLQASGQLAVINGLLDYDLRHGYRGPEGRLETSSQANLQDWIERLKSIPTLGGLEPAAVIKVEEQSVTLLLADGLQHELGWDQGLSNARPFIDEDRRGPAPKTAAEFLAVGDLVRIVKRDGIWRLSQVPAVQASLVAVDPQDGAIRALVGGFDFRQSHFNRAVQGHRLPGSAFKPFLYTIALENGFTPASVINDAPIVIENTTTGVSWRPENDGGTFSGPMRLRQALYRSRNLVSIRLLRTLGLDTALQGLERFGFDTSQFPRDLTLALGTHAIPSLQLATGYATFANGGFKVDAHLITRIEDDRGQVVYEANPLKVCLECEQAEIARKQLLEKLSEQTSESFAFDGTEPHHEEEETGIPIDTNVYAPRIVDERVIYLMDSMLKDVILKGTGLAARVLDRADIAGKTGTTNGPRDTWFAGYSPHMVAVSWVGFDQHTLLGRREYGGLAALPIWTEFMAAALAGKPQLLPSQPDGVVTVRINPETGLRAAPDDPDAIFEIFLAEDVPDLDESNESQATDLLPDDLF